MRLEEIAKIQEEFSTEYPQFELKEFLGAGGSGLAFAFSEGKVLKLTADTNREVIVCNALQGRQNKYLCNIELVGGNFYSISQEQEYTWITMERLYIHPHQEWVNQALQDFRRSWSDLYKNSNFTWSDLWSIYRKRELSKINLCKQHYVNYIHSTCKQIASGEVISKNHIDKRVNNAYTFFDFIGKAYEELFSICEDGFIDLNKGNFMFDKNGNLKALDLQIEI